MKKTICLLITVIIAISALASVQTSAAVTGSQNTGLEENEPSTPDEITDPEVTGDVNFDGSVDVLDSVCIRKYTVEKLTFTDKQLKSADVNFDGVVDVMDAVIIQKYAVGKITEFRCEKWRGIKWCAVGDSITEKNSRATKNYIDYIAEKTGIDGINMGHSGTGYKRRFEDEKAFYQRIGNLPNNSNVSDCDVVTIFGSFNDAYYFFKRNDDGVVIREGGKPVLDMDLIGTAYDTGTDTLGGCINTTIDYIREKMPKAKLGIITSVPMRSHNKIDKTTGDAEYNSLLKEICKIRNIPFYDLYTESLLRPWEKSFRDQYYTRDTIKVKDNEGNDTLRLENDGTIYYAGEHPDENGHKIIADQIEGFLEELISEK
jgi:hypothetical protein